jgi:hypothetical protein
MAEEKINYGINPLKKGERRATMKESIEKNKVNYYGLKKVDPVLLKHYLEKKKQKNSREDIVKKMFSLKRKLASLLKQKKTVTAPKKVEEIKKKLAKILPEYKEALAQFDTLEAERKKKIAKEEKEEKKKEKGSKKTTKKTKKAKKTKKTKK